MPCCVRLKRPQNRPSCQLLRIGELRQGIRPVLQQGHDLLQRRTRLSFEKRSQEGRKAGIVRALDVLLVHPERLLRIELCRRAAHVREIEPLDQLRARKYFFVAV